MSRALSTLNLQEQSNSGQNPLSWLLFRLEVEGPNVGGASCACLIDRALIHVLGVHAVYRDGFDEDDWH